MRPHRRHRRRPVNNPWATSLPAAPSAHEIVLAEILVIPFELVPRDIAWMVILYQDAPFFDGLLVAIGLLRPTLYNCGSCFRLAERVCPCKHWVGQNPQNRVVHRRSPLYSCTGRVRVMHRQLNSLAPEFHQDLTGTAQRRKPIKDRMDRLLDPPIRVDLDLSAGCPTVARRQVALELAAASFLPHCFQRSLSEQVKFEFIHCPFQSKEQSIIRRARVVHPFRIDDDGAHESTQLDEMVPIPPIPR
jgi:hypothetical protein